MPINKEVFKMFEVWIFNEESTDAMLFGIYDTYMEASYMSFICGGEVLEV